MSERVATCGNDRFLPMRRIITSGNTATFTDDYDCEKCGAVYENPGHTVAFKFGRKPARSSGLGTGE